MTIRPTSLLPGSSHTSSPTLSPAEQAKDAKLRKAANDLEGVFVQQMYKSMRDTVPTDGPFNGGSGEDMFTGLLDQHIAADTPSQWHDALGQAIYRQLHQRSIASSNRSE
jgi:flagellar protein FlgJ